MKCSLQVILCFYFPALFLHLVAGVFPIEKDDVMNNAAYHAAQYARLTPLLDAATRIAESFMNKTGIFNAMGGIFSVPEEVQYYARLANLPNVSVICDIGFNAGHSAITFLESNTNATVISFDINKLPWTMNSVAYVQDKYKNRFHFVQGDSGHSMQRAAKNSTIMHGLKCDLLSVDGNHSYLWHDVWAGYFVSRFHAYVVADDYASHMTKILSDWNHAIKKKIIKEIDCHKDVQPGRGWCLAIYLNEDV